MRSGELVPDDMMVRMFLDRLDQPDATRGRHPRRLPAHPAPGRGARRGPRRRGAARRPGAAHRGARSRTSSGGWPAAASARPAATSTTSRSNPPRCPGVCDIDGSPLVHRADDDEADGPGADGPAARPARRGRRLLPRPRASCVPVDGRRADRGRDRRACSTRDRRGRGRAGLMITRKSAARDRADAPAGRIVAEVLALVESELKPGVTTGHLDRLAERHIRAAGAMPSFMGYLGGGSYGKGRTLPGQHCASRSTTRSSTASPASGPSATGRSCRSTSGAIVDGWHGDGGPDVHRRRGRRRRRASSSTRPALAMMAGIAAARPGRRLGDISAAIEDVGAAARLRHRPAVRRATASAPRCTRSRRSRTTAPARAGAELAARACASRSSRCSPSAAATSTSSPTAGPWSRATAPRRPLRAHDRDHGQRARDPRRPSAVQRARSGHLPRCRLF